MSDVVVGDAFENEAATDAVAMECVPLIVYVLECVLFGFVFEVCCPVLVRGLFVSFRYPFISSSEMGVSVMALNP